MVDDSNTDDQRINFDRLKEKYSFFKFLLGTVLLGLVTATINFTLQWRQIKEQKLEFQNDQVAAYLDQFIYGGIDQQLSFANFMRFNAVEDDDRIRNDSLFRFLEAKKAIVSALEKEKENEIREFKKSIAAYRAKEDSLIEALKDVSLDQEKVRSTLAEIRQKEKETSQRLIEANQEEIELERQINNPVGEAEQAGEKSADVIIPVKQEEFTKSGWSIDNRYMQYGKFRVFVNNPSSKEQEATLTVYFVEEHENPKLIGGNRLRSGERITYKHKAKKYSYEIHMSLDLVSKWYRFRNKAEWTMTVKKVAK